MMLGFIFLAVFLILVAGLFAMINESTMERERKKKLVDEETERIDRMLKEQERTRMDRMKRLAEINKILNFQALYIRQHVG